MLYVADLPPAGVVEFRHVEGLHEWELMGRSHYHGVGYGHVAERLVGCVGAYSEVGEALLALVGEFHGICAVFHIPFHKGGDISLHGVDVIP